MDVSIRTFCSPAASLMGILWVHGRNGQIEAKNDSKIGRAKSQPEVCQTEGFFHGRPRQKCLSKCLVFQDLEGLTKVFDRMLTGVSRPKLPLWADLFVPEKKKVIVIHFVTIFVICGPLEREGPGRLS